MHFGPRFPKEICSPTDKLTLGDHLKTCYRYLTVSRLLCSYQILMTSDPILDASVILQSNFRKLMKLILSQYKLILERLLPPTILTTGYFCRFNFRKFNISFKYFLPLFKTEEFTLIVAECLSHPVTSSPLPTASGLTRIHLGKKHFPVFIVLCLFTTFRSCPRQFLSLSHEDCQRRPGGCPASCSRIGPGDIRIHLGASRRSEIEEVLRHYDT